MTFQYTLLQLKKLWHKNATLKAIGNERGAQRVDELWQAMELLKLTQSNLENLIKAVEHLQFKARGGWSCPENNPEYVKWTNIIKILDSLPRNPKPVTPQS